MFISKPHLGLVYVAEWLRRHSYRWSVLPYEPTSGLAMIAPERVPYPIRRQAYRYFYRTKE